jgi:hypothetical protein
MDVKIGNNVKENNININIVSPTTVHKHLSSKINLQIITSDLIECQFILQIIRSDLTVSIYPSNYKERSKSVNLSFKL